MLPDYRLINCFTQETLYVHQLLVAGVLSRLIQQGKLAFTEEA